ncbi:acyl-homoserine-lactone synthase [Paracoccus sp. 1_MG-2023]|uniref:acyl-homoserine-lactone synthase n=1 Tax=unclassified Paracoccus (in: a-proteobacteria) TaxID=2688777 RepID=UPI001C08F1D9|nr:MULTISPECIES: acyl-homoserine-lactone synthase [unclassified Paracoccus (in: a-proteobacteria)]MBU2956121.1 hypothetical protein [Paracoccus sp. C2R09]MDO6670391.1 acyl-homoserine-lactone synthase [Paracoccus sp. 1_MG-2023]
MRTNNQDYPSVYQPEAPSDYEVRIIRYPEGIAHWHLVSSYLKLRKEVFVDRLEWPLFHVDDLEFEQYDSFDTTYIVATRGLEVVGGARLRRTDQRSGGGRVQYSYMIRDACLGILPGLPINLCDEVPPQDEGVWELTRMVVNGPKDITRLILQATNEFLSQKGAASLMFLGSPAFLRMAKTWKWPAKQLGPVTGNDDGRFQVIECPVRKTQ